MVYMNCPYWIGFLDDCLWMPGYNILKDNIFIILSLLTITVLARLYDIIHITICLKTCWYAGNCHILSDYNWYVRSMEKMVDELETTIEAIEEDGVLIVNEGFMMVIFQGIMDKLPPFEKYWSHMFQNKSMPVVGEFQSKVLQFSILGNDIIST